MLCFYSHLFLTNFSHRILQDSLEKRDTLHFHVIRPSCQNFQLWFALCDRIPFLENLSSVQVCVGNISWSVLGRAVNHGLHKYLPVTIVYLHDTYIHTLLAVENFGGKMGFWELRV